MVAQRLAGRGYRTALIARRADRLEALADELSARAPSIALPLDLSELGGIEPAIQALLREHGPVEVLVNNAGYSVYRRFIDYEEDDFDRLTRVNYLAPAAMIRAVLPSMVARQKGWVINVASIAAKMGPWGHAGYAAAKAGLIALTQSLEAEHGSSALHFCYVNPGLVRTEFFDHPSYAPIAGWVRGRALPARLVAKRIVSLLDRPRLELVLPRYFRLLDWIGAISPRLAHRIVKKSSRIKPVTTPRRMGV